MITAILLVLSRCGEFCDAASKNVHAVALNVANGLSVNRVGLTSMCGAQDSSWNTLLQRQ